MITDKSAFPTCSSGFMLAPKQVQTEHVSKIIISETLFITNQNVLNANVIAALYNGSNFFLPF